MGEIKDLILLEIVLEYVYFINITDKNEYILNIQSAYNKFLDFFHMGI